MDRYHGILGTRVRTTDNSARFLAAVWKRREMRFGIIFGILSSRKKEEVEEKRKEEEEEEKKERKKRGKKGKRREKIGRVAF